MRAQGPHTPDRTFRRARKAYPSRRRVSPRADGGRTRLVKPGRRAACPGRRVLAWLAAAGLMLALLPAAGAAASVRQAAAPGGTGPGHAALAGRIIGIDPGHNGLNYTS